jgi:hypothetical protein
MQQKHAFDMAVLRAREVRDYELPRKTLDRFLLEMPVCLRQLRYASEIKKFQMAESLACLIKKSASHVGGEAFSKLAGEMEIQAHYENDAEISARLPELEDSYQLLVNEIVQCEMLNAEEDYYYSIPTKGGRI